MNKNVIELFNTLSAKPKLLDEFNNKKDLEELYKFSLSVKNGYTMEEFKDSLNEIAKTVSNHHGNIQEVTPGELECIAGGLSMMDSQKLKSLMLTSLLATGGIVGIQEMSGSNSVHAYSPANTSVTENNSKYDNSGKYANNKTKKTGNNTNENQKNDNQTENNTNENQKNDTQTGNNTNIETSILVPPSPENIKYGQNLSSSTLLGGKANVKGWFKWVTPYAKPSSVGEHTFWVCFTPYDNNLSTKTLKVKVKVEKATPKILKNPKASNITYGDALYNSVLSGGEAEVSGSFIWKDDAKHLYAGSNQYADVVFVPNDEKNYKRVNLRVPVNVKKVAPNIKRQPHASEIVYGQPLSASRITGLEADTPGTVKWASPDTKLTAGIHKCSVIFTPYSDNHESKTIEVNVTVNKATPQLEKNSFSEPYKPNATLKNFKLPKGWRWQNPDMHLDNIGRFEARAVHDETDNYAYRSETIYIEITKAEPQAPSFNVTYNPYTHLSDISLPVGWHWIDGSETPTTTKSYYKASFDAYEAGTPFYYSKDYTNIFVNVRQAVPTIYNWAHQYTDVAFGTDLSTVPLQGGISEVPGTFRLAKTTKDLYVGNHMCKVIFTPENNNYSLVESVIPITISKNMIPLDAPQMPETTRTDNSVSFNISNFENEVEFSKDGGKTWQSSPTFENLSPGTPYNFNIRYKETDCRCAGHASDAVRISTKFSSPDAPSAPVAKSSTRHKIIMEPNDNLEFSIDNGQTWQSSNKFTDLKRKTEYTVVSRLKETDEYMPSKPSEPVTVKTTRFPRPLSWLFG